jgi:50S ribosomal protein L16 3-hydroxylase
LVALFYQYDVFLIQCLGIRIWQFGPICDPAAELLPHDDLRLLADFKATDDWILEPGDILYVPPRFAHNGVAVGDDCMTYSVGFRAPSRSELIAHYCDDLLSRLEDDDRYSDPGLPAQENPGEISADALGKLHAMIAETMLDRAAFTRWFGAYNSTPKYPDTDWQPEEAIDIKGVRARLAEERPLSRNPASRFSFVQQDADAVLLFVDGRCFECTKETIALAQQLCASDYFAIDPALRVSDAATDLIARLVNQGSVAFEPED